MLNIVHRSEPKEPPAAKNHRPSQSVFAHAARLASHWLGTPWAFAIAVGTILVWAALGPLLAFSTTWQLFINTGTTIVTFLMVFLIQNTQNRESQATQIKLDELLRATRDARTGFVDLEELSDAELSDLQERFRELGHRLEAQAERDDRSVEVFPRPNDGEADGRSR